MHSVLCGLLSDHESWQHCFSCFFQPPALTLPHWFEKKSLLCNRPWHRKSTWQQSLRLLSLRQSPGLSLPKCHHIAVLCLDMHRTNLLHSGNGVCGSHPGLSRAQVSSVPRHSHHSFCYTDSASSVHPCGPIEEDPPRASQERTKNCMLNLRISVLV